jgi:hypothetical protein
MMPGGGWGSGWQTNKLSEEGSDVIYVLSSVVPIANTVSHTCLLACFCACKQYMNKEEQREPATTVFWKETQFAGSLSLVHIVVVVISDRVDCIHKQSPLSYYILYNDSQHLYIAALQGRANK